jgi:predicted TPR repeat methyltransferase
MADWDSALRSAVALHRSGDLASAEAAYQAILANAPDHVGALHFLGVLRHQQGDDEAALDLVRRAAALAPGDADVMNNLGNILLQTAAPAEAETAYRAVLELRPDHADGYNNLGLVLGMLGRPAEAEAALEQAIALAPRRAEFHHNLGLLLRRGGHLFKAVAAFKVALALDPSHPFTPEALAHTQYLLRRTPGDAIQTLSEWIEREPDHPAARHLLSALTGMDVAPRASDRYIKHLFDSYAAGFDDHLARLDYDAPRTLIAAVRAGMGEPAGNLRVLDAGCGTGRWGELLRPFARTLTGIDLSNGMLKQAERNRGYDTLEEAEISQYLAAQDRAYDLIFSADTLIYFGDLEAVFAGASGALEPGGHLAFTLEQLMKDEEGLPFALQFNGRYAHTRPYLMQALAATGFEIVSLETGVLRRERDEPVIGWITVARKPAA